MAKMVFRKYASLVGWMIIAGLPVIALADAQEAFPADRASESGQTLEVESCILRSASIKKGSGKVEVSSVDAVWSWTFLSLEYQGKFYDWESPVANPFSPAQEPAWNALYTTWLAAGYSNALTRKLHYAVEADVFISFERDYFGLMGNDMDGALFYSFLDGWNVYGGVAVHHSPFQTDVYPLFGLMCGVEADPGWSFNAGVPETIIRYRFNPRYSMDAGFSVLNVDYYLLSVDDAGDHDRYLETSDNRLFLDFAVTPHRNLSLGLGVQYTVDNQLMFYSANQQNRTSYRMTSVPGLLLKMQYGF